MGSGNIGKILKLGPNWMDNREIASGGDKLYENIYYQDWIMILH